MAYRDPYVDQYNLGTQHNYHSSYAPRQTYDDIGPDYDPYSTAYDTESNQPYHDSNPGTQAYPPQRLPSTKIAKQQPSKGDYVTDANGTNIPVVAVAPVRREGSGFDKGEFTPITPKCAVTFYSRDVMFTLGEIDQFVLSRIIGLIIRGTCGRKYVIFVT